MTFFYNRVSQYQSHALYNITSILLLFFCEYFSEISRCQTWMMISCAMKTMSTIWFVLFYAISFLVYVFHVLVQYTQYCTKTKLSLLKMVFTHFNCKACTIEKCHVYKHWDETTFSSLMRATNVCNLLVLIVNIKRFVCRSTKRTAILNQM